MNNIYIAHGGPGSGRYPWGSGERPYQRLEKPKGFFARRKYNRAMKDLNQLNQKELRRQQILAQKEKILKSGTASQVAQLRGLLTNEELKNVYSRLEYENKISAYAQSELQPTMEKINRMSKNLGTLTQLGGVAIDAYNLIAAIANSSPSVESGGGKKWAIIKKPGMGGQQNQPQGKKK